MTAPAEPFYTLSDLTHRDLVEIAAALEHRAARRDAAAVVEPNPKLADQWSEHASRCERLAAKTLAVALDGPQVVNVPLIGVAR